MIKRFLGTASALLLAAALFVPGQAEARSLNEILESGEIRVGVNPTLPPLAKFNEKNEIVGFDVDFSRKIAEMLGVDLELVKVQSTDRIPFVKSGKIDYVMGAMTRTPDRAKVVDYTLPVHTEVFGVLTTEGHGFGHWKDLNSEDVTLVQVRGTTPVPFIKENLPKAELLLLDNYPDVIRALAQGRGDALVDVIDFVGGHMDAQKNVDWQILDTPVDVYYCGLGLQAGNESLQEWLNVAIYELHSQGFVDEIWKKWFGMEMIKSVEPSPYF